MTSSFKDQISQVEFRRRVTVIPPQRIITENRVKAFIDDPEQFDGFKHFLRVAGSPSNAPRGPDMAGRKPWDAGGLFLGGHMIEVNGDATYEQFRIEADGVVGDRVRFVLKPDRRIVEPSTVRYEFAWSVPPRFSPSAPNNGHCEASLESTLGLISLATLQLWFPVGRDSPSEPSCKLNPEIGNYTWTGSSVESQAVPSLFYKKFEWERPFRGTMNVQWTMDWPDPERDR